MIKELSTKINVVEKVDDRLYIITETKSIHCYLIIGDNNAVVFDVGYGYENILPIIRKITNLPIIPILSHGDPDHGLGSSHFDDIWVHNLDYGKLLLNDNKDIKWKALQYRYNKMPELVSVIDEETFLSKRIFPNTRPHFLGERDAVDIGGTVLEVIHTPGHSYGHIMLLDRKNKRLFSGDQVTHHNVWYFLDQNQQAPFSLCVQSLKKIVALKDLFIDIYPAHDVYPITIKSVYEQIDCFENDLPKTYKDDVVFKSFIGNGYQHFYKSCNIIYSDERLEQYLNIKIERNH